MRLFGRRREAAEVAPRGPYDRYLRGGHFAALGAGALLVVLAVVPPVLDASAPNSGGDIHITTEFYTAFDQGGGHITWDLSPNAARTLRQRLDNPNYTFPDGRKMGGNGNGFVEEREAGAFLSSLDAVFERAVLVMRNFEIQKVSVEEQRGIAGEWVDNSTEPLHVKLLLAGRWASRDADVSLAFDAALISFYGYPVGSEAVRERTLIIAGGVSSFTASSLNARTIRAPAGSVVVNVRAFTGNLSAPPPPDVHFSLLSPIDSTLVLLAPLAIAYLAGVRGARRVNEVSGLARIVPFHNALGSAFLLLLASYFAGIPGLVIWIGGATLGGGGMVAAMRWYSPESAAAHAAAGQPTAPPPLDEEDFPGDPELDDATVAPLLLKVQALQAPPPAPVAPPAPPATAPSAPWSPKSAAPSASFSAPPPPAPAAAPAAPALPLSQSAPPKSPKTKVRCPGCKNFFSAEGPRPLHITCPHCAKKGVLR